MTTDKTGRGELTMHHSAAKTDNHPPIDPLADTVQRTTYQSSFFAVPKLLPMSTPQLKVSKLTGSLDRLCR